MLKSIKLFKLLLFVFPLFNTDAVIAAQFSRAELGGHIEKLAHANPGARSRAAWVLGRIAEGGQTEWLHEATDRLLLQLNSLDRARYGKNVKILRNIAQNCPVFFNNEKVVPLVAQLHKDDPTVCWPTIQHINREQKPAWSEQKGNMALDEMVYFVQHVEKGFAIVFPTDNKNAEMEAEKRRLLVRIGEAKEVMTGNNYLTIDDVMYILQDDVPYTNTFLFKARPLGDDTLFSTIERLNVLIKIRR